MLDKSLHVSSLCHCQTATYDPRGVLGNLPTNTEPKWTACHRSFKFEHSALTEKISKRMVYCFSLQKKSAKPTTTKTVTWWG